MHSHPILLSILTAAGLIYIGGAFLMLQIHVARPGYEDENGFHFSDTFEDVVVPADEVRPAWFTGQLAERFASHRAEIFVGVAA